MKWLAFAIGALGLSGWGILRGSVWLARHHKDWSQGPITIENWRDRLRDMTKSE